MKCWQPCPETKTQAATRSCIDNPALASRNIGKASGRYVIGVLYWIDASKHVTCTPLTLQTKGYRRRAGVHATTEIQLHYL